MLAQGGIQALRVSKGDDERDGPSALALMRKGEIDLVVNVAREYDPHGLPDGAMIRRLAVDLEIPLITDLMGARAIVRAIGAYPRERLDALPWRAYLN
jgi:carbamoyl-phosphate synthase large subunit